jgi:hypothetical protein
MINSLVHYIDFHIHPLVVVAFVERVQGILHPVDQQLETEHLEES